MNTILKTHSTATLLLRTGFLQNKILIRSIATLPRAITEVTHCDYQVPQEALDHIEKINSYTFPLDNHKPNLLFEHGQGCYLYDSCNREYMDFSAGNAVNALGHSDPQVAQDLLSQAQKLISTNHLYHNTNTGLLAEKLVELTRSHSHSSWASKVFLTNSGNEANEAALKLARKYGKSVGGVNKTKLVCFTNACHGQTMGAASVTPTYPSQAPYAPLIPDVTVLPFNNIYEILHEVNQDTAGVIIEPIQSEGGMHMAEPEFMSALRRRCTETNALLIFDESQCGLGRTGKMWAHQHYSKDCTPDILTMSNPLANGIPIGAVMVTDDVADKVSKGDHGSKFGGNPLAAAVATGVIDRITNANFLKKVNETSWALRRDLDALQEEYPEVIRAVRGEGLLLGVEFFKNPQPLVKLARERGLLVSTALNNTIRILPPLILTKSEAREGIARLSGAIDHFALMKK